MSVSAEWESSSRSEHFSDESLYASKSESEVGYVKIGRCKGLPARKVRQWTRYYLKAILILQEAFEYQHHPRLLRVLGAA